MNKTRGTAAPVAFFSSQIQSKKPRKVMSKTYDIRREQAREVGQQLLVGLIW